MGLLLLGALRPAVSSADSSLSFFDSNGEPWERWVLTERQPQKTLLLVVENPVRHRGDDVVSQRLVYRREFLNSKPELLRQMITHFKMPPTSVAPWVEDQAQHQPLWEPIRNDWTPQDEQDYSTWYKANVNPDFLVGSGISVDCAKFATALRWIYAHDRRLTVANTLAASHKLVGQWIGTAAWDALKTDPDWRKDRRFLAALQYVLDQIYTHSIFNDLYPTELNQNYVNPGSVLLVLYSGASGHTQVIDAIGSDPHFCPAGECISVLYGNEPPSEHAFKDLAWIINGGGREGGFMRWRWPVINAGGKNKWGLVPAARMPGYSLQQYSQPKLDDEDFKIYVFKKLGIQVTDTQLAVSLGNAMLTQLQVRLELTSLGYLLCSLQKCDPSSELYSDYSSVSHDVRFRENQESFLKLLKTADLNDPDFQNFFLSAKVPVFLHTNPSAYDYITNADGLSDKMTSDPTAPFFARWGLDDSDVDVSTYAFSRAWYQGLLSRQDEVAEAQRLCYPGGSALPCDPKSSRVESLSTRRLDASLRVLRAQIVADLQKASPQGRDAILSFAKDSTTSETFCHPGSGQSCTLYDFVFSSRDWVEAMSSDPTDPYDQRWGFDSKQ